MNEAQRVGVQCLTWQHIERIFYETSVLGINCSLSNTITAVLFVIEYRMSQMRHMYSDLMSSSGFQFAFYQTYVVQRFDNLIMCHRMLPFVSLLKHCILRSVRRVPTDVPLLWI